MVMQGLILWQVRSSHMHDTYLQFSAVELYCHIWFLFAWHCHNMSFFISALTRTWKGQSMTVKTNTRTLSREVGATWNILLNQSCHANTTNHFLFDIPYVIYEVKHYLLMCECRITEQKRIVISSMAFTLKKVREN